MSVGPIMTYLYKCSQKRYHSHHIVPKQTVYIKNSTFLFTLGKMVQQKTWRNLPKRPSQAHDDGQLRHRTQEPTDAREPGELHQPQHAWAAVKV